MAHNILKKYVKKTMTALLAVAMTVGCMAAAAESKQVFAAGTDKVTQEKSKTEDKTGATDTDKTSDTAKKTEKKEEVNLRFILTTDLHGTVSSMDYIGGTSFPNAGLSRAYQLIETAREEVGRSNALTLDAGDVLFDASMEYVLDQDSDAIQPIYQAMALVGYDAITLGNHDFDYGKEYILRQLSGSGLMDKVVVSNLKNSKDDSYPFLRNMMITREAISESGEKVTVNIGIIGETIPTLSTKTDNYTGIWKGEDIVENVRKESKLLKEQGADIVVALVHSGFGDEEPEYIASNAAYALTKIDEVDVVLCGHEHNAFPDEKTNLYYNSMPGVDVANGTVNGKVVVMAKSLARSIGVADLTLEYDKTADNFEIITKKGENRHVSDYKTTENKAIVNTFSEWKEEMESYRSQEIATLKEGTTIQNYFSLFEDSNALQLQNDARIAYARRYIERFDKTYANYPVIAAASNYSFGANSAEDFVQISGKIKQSDLFTLQSYRQYTCIYKVTGAQLREWMEWTAGMYNTMNANDMMDLISDEWKDNWANYFVFDGIQYTIDPYVKPRYNVNGIKINNTRRISNLTYNGQPVTDEMEFVIASNSLSSLARTNPLFEWANTQMIRNLYRTQVLLAEFLQNETKNGGYEPLVDNNWKLALSKNQEFIVAIPKIADEFAVKSSWYKETLIEGDEYNYYCGIMPQETKIVEPYIVVAPELLDPTTKGYQIFVDTFSDVGIKSIRYMLGDYKINAGEWGIAREVKNGKFSVYSNEIYSILVEDNNEKRKLYKLMIDNIGVKEMVPPKVWSFSNKKSSLTGRTEAGVTVLVETEDKKTYKTRSNSDGSYSINLPTQKAGTLLYVYAKDEMNDRESKKVKVMVKRSGPDQLTIDKYYNNSEFMTGKTNEEDALVIAVVDNIRRVYVPKNGGIQRLEQSTDLELTNFRVVEVAEYIDSEGNFSLELPDIDVGTSIKLYNIDHVGRVSKVLMTTVNDGGPYTPEVVTITNVDNVIYGNVKSEVSGKQINITVFTSDKVYKTKTDENGYFSISLDKLLSIGENITVYAEDYKEGIRRESRYVKLVVSDIQNQEFTNNISIYDIDHNAQYVEVTYLPTRDLTLVIPTLTGKYVITGVTNTDGKFRYKVPERLEQGAYVYAYHRNNIGKLVGLTASIIKYEKPKTPYLLNDITNTHKTVRVVTEQDVKVIIQVGDRVYESQQGKLSNEHKGYVHIIQIEKVNAGTKIKLSAANKTTNSDTVEITVSKIAPDMPTVKTVTVDSISIEGKVDLFLLDSTEKATVKNTKTKVYAKINNINYPGVIDTEGKFTIQVPKLKAGDVIKVYASNKNGYGPIRTITLP